MQNNNSWVSKAFSLLTKRQFYALVSQIDVELILDAEVFALSWTNNLGICGFVLA